MRSQDTYTRMTSSPGAQSRSVRTNHRPVKPIGRQIELSVRRQRVRTLEDPIVAIPNGDATMTAGVPEERDEVHLRCKGETDRLEPLPVRRGPFIKHPARAVSKIETIIETLCPALRTLQSIIFSLVEMNLGAWKIRKAARMIEVQVSQNNVPDGLRPIAQPRDLAEGRSLGIPGDAKSQAKEMHQRRGARIIVEPEAGVHQDRSLIRFDEQTGRAYMPAREPGFDRRAIEYANGHAPHSHCYASPVGTIPAVSIIKTIVFSGALVL